MNFIIILIFFILLDIPYMFFFAKNTFGKMIFHIQYKDIQLRYKYTFFVYLLMTLGFITFINKDTPYYKSFILGVVIYGVFNFVNYSIFYDYKLKPAIIDTIWGGVLYSLVLLIYKNYIL